MKRLGVLGTMVWDTIYRPGAEAEPEEEWGGISYALNAFEAALPVDWCFVPLVKVGSDLAPLANRFLSSLERKGDASRFIEVPQPNMRVTLRYSRNDRNTETLSGSSPTWTWEQLGPMVRDLDALYVNFTSGTELRLETARRLRRAFPGLIYVDLHSLLLAPDGVALCVSEALEDATGWFSCFDVIQLNEDELRLLGNKAVEVAARAMAEGAQAFIVTLGSRGALSYSTGEVRLDSEAGSRDAVSGPIRTAHVPPVHVERQLDSTGCGDVFGAATVSYLLRGASVEKAIAQANILAASNLSYRGTRQLFRHLHVEGVHQ